MKKVLTIGSIALVAVIALGLAGFFYTQRATPYDPAYPFGGYGMMGGYGHMNGYGMMGGYGFGTFGLIGMILNLVITVGLIVGVVLLVVWLVRRISANDDKVPSMFSQSGAQPTPREILQTRYARGEISRDEYQQVLVDISQG